MNITVLNVFQKSRLARRLVMGACFAFTVLTLVQWYNSKTIGGNYKPAQRFNGRDYPLFLHPHYADDQPDLETLTFKRDFLLQFKDKGQIYFHVNKYRESENSADGVTLEIYADDSLIFSKLENPYAVQNNLYAEDNQFQTIIIDFDIPKETKKLAIRVNANGNTASDHVWLEQVIVTKSNSFEKCVLLLVGFIFLLLLRLEWKPTPIVKESSSSGKS